MPTPYTPPGTTFPAFPWNLVKDGEVYNFDSIQQSADPAKGLFGKCMDAIAYLYVTGLPALSTALAKQTASSGDTLVGVLTYVGTYLTIPTGTLRGALQYIANNAAAAATLTTLSTRVTALAGGIAGASNTRFSSGLAVPVPPAEWTSISGLGDWGTSVAILTKLILPLSDEALPHGSTLTGVTVQITPDNTHASLAGLTLPTIEIWAIPSSGIAVQIGSTTSDSSATFGAYNVNHPISIAGLSHTVDRSTNRYVVLFHSENGGANAKANCSVFGVKATYTTL